MVDRNPDAATHHPLPPPPAEEGSHFHGSSAAHRQANSAALFFKVCGSSHRPRPRAANLQNRSALALVPVGISLDDEPRVSTELSATTCCCNWSNHDTRK